jgi:hypothetical protein
MHWDDSRDAPLKSSNDKTCKSVQWCSLLLNEKKQKDWHVISSSFFIQNRLGGRGKLRIDNYVSISQMHFCNWIGFFCKCFIYQNYFLLMFPF